MSTLVKNNPLAKAIKYALLAGASATVLTSPMAFAAEENDEEAEKVTVTGSRIKRSDVEGALPVTVIDREQIELSGESSAADFLRNLTFNSSGSFRPQSGSSAQGVSTISLRGLGSSRSLVLVDGRRLPKSGSTGSSQDLNAIPMAAIERIEVLTDGASAIYGSDAIGGVINIITRTDYEGAEITIGRASVSIPDEGGDREEGSIVFGAAGESTRLIAGISWNDRDIIFASDFPWNVPGGSIYGNSFTTLTDGFDNFNWQSIPDGNGGTACDFPGTGFYTLGARCAYDFTLVSADEASTKNKSLFVKAVHEINEDWELYSDMKFAQTESFGRYAPVPDSSYFSTPLTADSPNNPTNPNGNVYDASLGLDPQQVNWWHRFDALGNRDGFVTLRQLDVLVGGKGMVGDVEVDFGYRKTSNRTDDVGRNYLLRSAAAELIESGAYDLSNPYGSDEDVLNAMKITIYRESIFDQEEAYATAAFDLFEMDGGTAGFFAGFDYRKESYSDQYDPQSEAGQVGGSAGNSAGGDRSVKALSFETLLPVMDTMEVSIAGRYDRYSDYGSNFSPKVSVRFQPMDELTLRASMGKGFLAPSLPQLTQKPSFSATSVRDEQSCLNQGQPANCSLQINDNILANPDLQAEESTQFSVGAAYEPTDWMNLTLDYYNIEIDNRIRSFDAQFLINSEVAGLPVPPGLGCQRSPNGSITECFSGFGNQGTVETSGIDLNIRTNLDIMDGRLSSNLQLSYQLDQSVDGGRDLVEDPGTPAYRMVISNNYAISDFVFAYNMNVIGEQFNDFDDDGNRIGHVPTWITHDFQASYNTAWDGRITLGVRNAGEKYPPVGLGAVGSRPYDFNLYDGYGRVSYIRYTQTF